MKRIPEFHTERLFLRGVTLNDVPAYTKHFVDYEVIRYLARAVPWPYPEDGVRTFLESVLPQQGKNRWLWGIFLRSNVKELIGVVDLWREGHPDHRGFWLGREYQDQGIMTEALLPVMDYAFENLGFYTMILANARGNRASRRVKEKTGSRLIRVVPGEFVDPTFTEQEQWELTRDAWTDFRSSHQPDGMTE